MPNNNRSRVLIESIKRLLRRDATTNLHNIVNKTHAADMATIFRSLTHHEHQKLFDLIEDLKRKGALLSELDEETLQELIEGIELYDIVEILEQIPADDVADILGRLPEEKSNAILHKMKKEGSEELANLLSYGEDTAGGIMVPDFISLKEDVSAKEAINSLQNENRDVEMPFYLYVVDEYGKLTGVCSLRQLVVVQPETALKDFMARDVFSVKTDMDQEEVAKIVARYDILAVPVVDDINRLVGIVTVDDVIDVLSEEATEDMYKMAGVGEVYIETQSVFKSTRIRAPWLLASCIGGIAAFYIIGHFEGGLKNFAYLAAFIPVIMGMGGNIGTQSSTIVVRGLATGRLSVRDIWSVVFKELAIGLILGLSYGLLVGVVAQIQYSMGMLAVSVGLALLSSMSIAALVGSLVPIVFARLNIDPAVATGPFVTTAIDIISVSSYFGIATSLISV